MKVYTCTVLQQSLIQHEDYKQLLIQHTEYTGLICDYKWPSLPLFWQLHWHSWWHTHSSLHDTWRSTPHAQSERLPLTKLSVCLWPQLLLCLHAYWMGWLNCGCHTVEWCTYFGFADAAGKVSSSQCRVWDIGCLASAILWSLVPSQGMAPGKFKVYLILVDW